MRIRLHSRLARAEMIQDGTDVAILSTGLMVNEAAEAGRILKESGISARVINLCTIKPLDEEIVLAAARDCGKIITCEEHSVIGGLGEAVCALLSEKHPTPVKRIGVNDEFGHSGPAAALLKEAGCPQSILSRWRRNFVTDARLSVRRKKYLESL